MLPPLPPAGSVKRDPSVKFEFATNTRASSGSRQRQNINHNAHGAEETKSNIARAVDYAIGRTDHIQASDVLSQAATYDLVRNRKQLEYGHTHDEKSRQLENVRPSSKNSYGSRSFNDNYKLEQDKADE